MTNTPTADEVGLKHLVENKEEKRRGHEDPAVIKNSRAVQPKEQRDPVANKLENNQGTIGVNQSNSQTLTLKM